MKVLDAIEGLTYEPNAGARALASQRTNVIGLVVPFHPGSDAAGMLPFIETIASSARARDHEVLLVTADEGSAGLRRLARRSLCDAIVMMDIEAHDERIPVAVSLRVPVVLVGVPEQPAGLRCVDSTSVRPARLAVDELAETGHDRVVCLGYPAEVTGRDLNYVRRFMSSVQERVEHHGLPYEIVAPVEPVASARERPSTRRLRSLGEGRLGLIIPAARCAAVLHALGAQGVVPGTRHLRDRRLHRRGGRTRRSRTSRSSPATSRGAPWRRCSGCSSRPAGPPPMSISFPRGSHGETP